MEANPGLEAKTLFGDLQRRYPGRFSEGQLRTLQRRIKRWRALEGPAKEVFFPQYYVPGERCQSDFTDLSGLAITLEYADGQLRTNDAITLLSNFAGRMEQPLRHLL